MAGDACGDAVASFPIGGDLSELRERAREFLTPAKLGERQESNFILAISEAANNVLDHARTSGVLVLRRCADRVVAEVSDEAGTLTDPLAGMIAPEVGSRRGYGLWLMRQMCDEVEIVSGPAGSTVRLVMRRD
ncbi:ATP-binding protein [Streptosporangium sp. NPDC004379]|uniref:ATP-binding protein n=1 Tax=Streptosporangium sp. NPDC004379 TaxID=3366189 RepID=UPI0036AE4B74